MGQRAIHRTNCGSRRVVRWLTLLLPSLLFSVITLVPQGLLASEAQSDYLAAVRAYADTMIKQGRDRYGKQPSPLFASALDRQSYRIGTFPSIDGVREHDRALTGSNPYHHTVLYHMLISLSEVTGQKSYQRAAHQALQFFVQHTQNDHTGLFTWGEHAYWDFFTEGIGGKGIHEINGPWPYWDIFYAKDAGASRKFVWASGSIKSPTIRQGIFHVIPIGPKVSLAAGQNFHDMLVK